ncbi:MAG: hypothetical protein KDE09_18785, partial [Anaerolineales bacterium]|nr:hypothetical protein [Anaerolineales bacterium]
MAEKFTGLISIGRSPKSSTGGVLAAEVADDNNAPATGVIAGTVGAGAVAAGVLTGTPGLEDAPELGATDLGKPMPVTVAIDGDTADVRVGGSGEAGDIRLFSRDDSLNPTIHIDGQAGDIRLLGADCAEEFAVATETALIEPGTVMVIGNDGRLNASCQAHDRRVAGVVSGAGAYKPGIILGKQTDQADYLPIALVGKVYCNVDTSNGPIQVGDLLTSSATPGHAMRAT